MADYSVLGGILRADLDFPELPRVPEGTPDWVVRVVTSAPPELALQPLGERAVGQERYRLAHAADRFRLEYSHAGTFDLSADGGEFCWYSSPDVNPELVRAILLGPLLALALELRGCFCLHGSAVAIDGSAIAFVAPKYHGKSTLATALAAAGATLISDDLLAVESDSPPRVRAGVPCVRLWEDTARELQVADLCDAVQPGVKTVASGFGGRHFSGSHASLAAIYRLSPETDGAGRQQPCWRTQLQGAAAAIALAHQTKLPASLVGIPRAAGQLKAAAAVAALVPVYTLHVPRDFARLGSAAGQIMAWHSKAAAAGERVVVL